MRLPRMRSRSCRSNPTQPTISGAFVTTAIFVNVLPPSVLRRTKTLCFASTLEASTILPLAGAIVIAYQNLVGGTPVAFVHVLPPSVVTDSDESPPLISQ